MMKIIIIKLGADGDVVRTLPIVKSIKNKYPDSEITWVTKGDIKEILLGVKYISKVESIPFETKENYDILYNFDIDDIATNLAQTIQAKEKKGFFSEGGYPTAFNSGSQYYIETMFDDELKKNNRKTYQEMMFMAAELEYNDDKYELTLDENMKKYANDFITKNKISNNKIIGIHMGASSRWPSKAWSEKKVKGFINLASKEGFDIILFGGPNEINKHNSLCNELEKEGVKIYRNNPLNSKKEFMSILSLCKIVICSDSFALHISIGLGKKTIGLFFCTTPYEVEDYGLLKKVVSPMFEEFFPERMNEYNDELVNSISSESILDIVKRL